MDFSMENLQKSEEITMKQKWLCIFFAAILEMMDFMCDLGSKIKDYFSCKRFQKIQAEILHRA